MTDSAVVINFHWIRKPSSSCSNQMILGRSHFSTVIHSAAYPFLLADLHVRIIWSWMSSSTVVFETLADANYCRHADSVMYIGYWEGIWMRFSERVPVRWTKVTWHRCIFFRLGSVSHVAQCCSFCGQLAQVIHQICTSKTRFFSLL